MNHLRQNSFIYSLIAISLFLRLFLFINAYNNPKASLQQDFYSYYARDLLAGGIAESSRENLRLFPGYPLVIAVINPLFNDVILSGVIISLVSTVFAIYLFWRITENRVATVLFSFFPPVWIYQGGKVATEPLCLLLLLLSVFLFLKNKYLTAGLVAGLATDVRLIAVCLFAALVIALFESQKKAEIFKLATGFAAGFSLLFLFNFLAFGADGVLMQFNVYPSFANATIGFIQVFRDILRTIDWGQYRILASGVFYLVINFSALYLLFKYRNKLKKMSFGRVSFYWILISLLFIFIYSPTPLLEEFSRFTVPYIPALIIGLLAINGKIYSKS